MTTPTQSAEGEIIDEIEKTLSSGTRLDPPTMNRLFRTIIPRLERGWTKKDETRRIFSTLLARIRVFDVHHFDKLMTDWTSHVRSMPDRSALADLFPLLISTGCLAMAILLGTASPPSVSQTSHGAAVPKHGSATYLQELFQLVIAPLPGTTGLTPEERYRFGTEQKCTRLEQAKGLLNLVRNSLIEFSILKNHPGGLDLPFNDDSCLDNLLETLRLLVLVDSNAVSQALNIKTLPTETSELVQKVTTRLLRPGASANADTSFDQILHFANELTLPFCQLKLNIDLSLSQLKPTESDSHGPSRFDLFAKAMDRAIESGNIMWTSLLPSLSDDITQHLKSQAQAGFLDLLPSSKTMGQSDTPSDSSFRMAENLLGVVEAIISGQPPPKTAQLTTAMAEKLTDLWEIVTGGAHERPETHAAVLQRWLPAMLRFITLHSLSSEPPSAPLPSAAPAPKPPIANSHDVRARVIIVLCSMLLELESLPSSIAGSLPQQIFDIALVLVDALPEDLRVQCAKTILLTPATLPSTSISSDPRLYYLFSAQRPAPTDNLFLSHREKASSALNAASRNVGAIYGIGPGVPERLTPFLLRRWEVLSEPTPNVGENDTSLNLSLFEAIKIQ